MNYERLLSYGDVIQLSINCNPYLLKQEVAAFPFRQYNSFKTNNPRYGLSITSIDGNLNGDDLESLSELKNIGKIYDEMSFSSLTDVYYSSKQIQNIVGEFKPFLGRTHILNLKKGGFFPPHRDDFGSEEQNSFRILVPLLDCNPPNHYFMYEDKILNFNHGYCYFINTNKSHSLFSFSDESLMVVINVQACKESYDIVLNNLFKR